MHNENSNKSTQTNLISTISKNKQSNDTRRTVDVYEVFCTLLVIATCFLGSSKNTILSLAVVTGFAAYILKPAYLVGPIFFMTIFDDYLVAFSGQSFSRFCVIFFCIGVILKMLIYQQRTKHVGEMAMAVIMLLLGILLSVVSVFGYTSFPISYVFNLILFICMMNFIPKNNDIVIKQLYKYTLFGIIFIAVLVAQNGTNVLLGTRLTIASDVNANQLAMGMTQMTAVVIAHLITNKKKIIDYFLIFILIAGLFLTGSRTGLIAALLCIITVYIVIIWRTSSSKKKVKSITTIVSLGAIICFLYFFLVEKVPDLMYRFTYENIVATGGTNRIDVWTALLTRALPGHYLFGIGFDPLNAYYAVQSINGIGHGSHNLIVEVLTKTGILGMGIYLAFFLKLLRKLMKNFRQYSELLFPFAIIIGILFNGIGEDMLTTRFLWFGVGVVYMLLNRSRKEAVQINKKAYLYGEKNG